MHNRIKNEYKINFHTLLMILIDYVVPTRIQHNKDADIFLERSLSTPHAFKMKNQNIRMKLFRFVRKISEIKRELVLIYKTNSNCEVNQETTGKMENKHKFRSCYKSRIIELII